MINSSVSINLIVLHKATTWQNNLSYGSRVYWVFLSSFHRKFRIKPLFTTFYKSLKQSKFLKIFHEREKGPKKLGIS